MEGMIVPQWSGDVTFPMTIRIPATYWVMNGGSRDITIESATDQVHSQIVVWMKNDLRYRTWFKVGEL